MSKFEQSIFYDEDCDYFVISKEKFTEQQAISLAIENLSPRDDAWTLAMRDCFVRHRAGINFDGEPTVGWWLEDQQYARSCPCWSFHVAGDNGAWSDELDCEFIRVPSKAAAQAGKGEAE